MNDQVLRERDWRQVLTPLFSSTAPERHVVIDGALHPADLAQLRSDLWSSWAWQYRAQPGYVLSLSAPESDVIDAATRRLVELLARFEPGLEVCESWAFLHQRPFEEFVHADTGSYACTLWLTPEKWDQSPDTSGLRLFPLARPDGMPNSRDRTLPYFKAQAVEVSAYIPYRENRAVLFPASTFHSIGPCDFEASSVATMRCTVSIFLDHQDHWLAQRQLVEATPETPNP